MKKQDAISTVRKALDEFKGGDLIVSVSVSGDKKTELVKAITLKYLAEYAMKKFESEQIVFKPTSQ